MALPIIAGKMVFGGDCLAKIDGRNIFVRGTLPGERAAVEIIREERDYAVAEAVDILEPSPRRAEPFCPLYGRCGGCGLQHADADYQRELRAGILRDAFAREGLTVPDIEVVAGDDRAYRARFQLHDGGLMARRTNTVIRLDGCPCATDEVNRYLAEVPPEERPAGRVHVFGDRRITSIPPGYDRLIIAQEGRPTRPRAHAPHGRKSTRPRYEGTSVNPANACTVSLCGRNIAFDVQGFFQSNLGMLEKALPLVTGGLEGHVLDLYAGAGTFSAFLAREAARVTLVEHNRDALVFAEQNLSGLPHESFGVNGESWVRLHAGGCIQRHGAFSAAVVDPPRSGMEKAVCRWLAESGILSVRSLSCDPATHARDARTLAAGGYRLARLLLLDFFPQTGHIESLAFFERQHGRCAA